MIPQKGIWNSVGGVLLVLLILAIPALVGYDVLYQWNTPTMDFYLDNPGSATVHSVVPGGKAYSAGLEAGDVILSVDDIQFKEWFLPQIGRTHIVKIERRGNLASFPIPAVRVVELNYIALLSAILVALVYWCIGTFLFLRKFWNPEIRILFLLSQAIAVTILFPLSFQNPWVAPAIGISSSKAGFCLLAPLYLHYAVSYPIKLGKAKLRIPGLIFLYACVPVLFWIWEEGANGGLSAAVFYSSAVTALAAAFMFYSYQYRSTPEGRRRTRVIIFGALASVVVPTVLYLIPRAVNSSFYLPEWLAGLFLIITPISYLYASLHYNLFGIDRLVNRTLVYAVLSFGVLTIYLVPYLFLYRYLPDDIYIQIIIIFTLIIWIGWTFDWLRTRAQRLVDHLFYGGWYDYPAVVELISDALARSSTCSQISDVLTKQVPRLMRLSNSNLWISNPHARLPTLPPLKASFRYKFQTDIPAQWTVDAHPDGDDLSDGDHRILHTLAQQAEIALNNAFTVEILQNQLDEISASREILAQTQRQLLRSREEERSRLARDLHDSPIQSLVGMNIQLGLLLNQKRMGKPLLEALSGMRSEIRQLSDELRQVCADLRPPMLDTLGLSSAISSLASEWSEQSGIAIHLDLCPDADLRSLPAEAAVNFYRVAQEALANIVKHARARQVNLSLQWIEKQLDMIIEDDGVGFDAPDTLHGLTAQSHFGLAGMRERIQLIGGQWSLKSEPGKGTVVHVIWQFDGKAS